MTKQQAINAVRNCANYIIEQRTRQARGWDQGKYRDDDCMRTQSIAQTVREESHYAFNLARQHRGVL